MSTSFLLAPGRYRALVCLSVLIATLGTSGCALLRGPLTSMPDYTSSSPELDPLLPEVAVALGQTDRFLGSNLLWVGAADPRWYLLRHELNGVVYGRSADFGYVFTTGNGECRFSIVTINQDFDGNQYGGTRVVTDVHAVVMGFPTSDLEGEAIDCAAIERATFGYRIVPQGNGQ